MTPRHSAAIRDALRFLGKERVVLGLFASAFPPSEADVCYGSPYSRAARRLFAYVRALGFNGVNLGPQGQVTEFNPSPYDGTVFARNTLSIDLASLAEEDGEGLLDESDLEAVARDAFPQERAHPRVARPLIDRALGAAYRRFRSLRVQSALSEGLVAFREAQAEWLGRDALYEALARNLGIDDPRRFPPYAQALFDETPHATEQRRQARAALDEKAGEAEFAQFIVHRQHAALRAELRAHGLALYGDLQAGTSHRDAFFYRSAFLPGYALGAPPSRTNPEGQPWGYPVYHPALLDDPESAAVRLLERRLDKLLGEYDGLRIDHPHGLVCPWVYKSETPEPMRAVQSGARLYASPDLPDHPQLGAWAIARREDLSSDPEVNRWDDSWVVRLDPPQIDRYARLMDRVVAVAERHGHPAEAIACEVLSTCPYPLARVLERHGMGRFRVTEKADVTDPTDVYLTWNARAPDWVMVSTHDTPPILATLDAWQEKGETETRARYLAERLVPVPGDRARFVRACVQERGNLLTACAADLFASDAKNVSVFFSDLFGERKSFNRPGVVDDDNWTRRLPSEFEALHAARIRAGEALDLKQVLALALIARDANRDLVRALQSAGQ